MSLRSFFKGAMLVTAAAALVTFITLMGICLLYTSIPSLVTQAVHSFSQIFKPEVPERRTFHGTPNASQTRQLRFKLTFTQMPFVPLILCLFPFPILLQKVRDLL